MGATKKATKRRARSRHPGVKIKRRKLPSGAVTYRAVFVDPDTNRETYLHLNPVALPTKEAREQWAIKKSKTLARRDMDLEAGAPRHQSKALADAVADYRRKMEGLRKRTQITYGVGIDRFAEWAAREGVTDTGRLDEPALARFREHVVALPRQSVKAGAGRGERKASARRRSPNTVNVELRSVKTMVAHFRKLGLTPLLTRDAITDALATLPAPVDLPAFLPPAKLQKLLQACQRHDADTYRATRDEHAGQGAPGGTRRHDPITPFTLFLILTGCRVSEALHLRWASVDLGALDERGQVAGEITLTADETKTARGRRIDLSVSPALRAMLASMKLSAGRANYLFGGDKPLLYSHVEAARKRLIGEAHAPAKPRRRADSPKPGKRKRKHAPRPAGYGAPKFSWQNLRQTTSTFLVNAPGIFGSASIYRAAAQLGHSVDVAQRRYVGLVKGIPRDAHTLEGAMQIRAHLLAHDTAQPCDIALRNH